MLGELQSFRWHKGLHCDNSLFCEGPEAWSAWARSHSRTTAGTHSAPYTQLCSNGPRQRRGRRGYCLIVGSIEEGRSHQWLLSALGHIFCLANPVRNIGHNVEPTRPANIVYTIEPRQQRPGAPPLGTMKTPVDVVSGLVGVCSRHERCSPLR